MPSSLRTTVYSLPSLCTKTSGTRERGGGGGERRREALLEPAGPDAGRVELLHDPGQDALDLGGRGPAPLGDLLELGAQVAVVVEVADDLRADPALERVLGREPELLVQVVGERARGAHEVLARQARAVPLRHERALLVVVEHHRVHVEGQLV